MAHLVFSSLIQQVCDSYSIFGSIDNQFSIGEGCDYYSTSDDSQMIHYQCPMGWREKVTHCVLLLALCTGVPVS